MLGVLMLAACGQDGQASDSCYSRPAPATTTRAQPTSPPASPSPRVRGTTITTFDSEYGPMLFDRSGQAIYLFDRETGAEPACYDACAAAWPPVLTRGTPAGDGRVRDRLLGTTRRADGSLQVTYAGHPLYFYAHEGKRQVLCHDVEEYGGLWLVVRPDGTPAPG
jgi:predicted lipoprotein with Yx(FWY)xxD motif